MNLELKTAKFICTVKNGKEIILMGFDDKKNYNGLIERVYNSFYEYGNFDSLYMKIAPIRYENMKFIV